MSGQLDGWKEIANYLGVSARAAQKWEKERGLPVQRLGDGPKARVFAEIEGLEAWRQRQSRLGAAALDGGRNWKLLWLASTAAAAAAAALLLVLRVPANPESADFVGNQLRMLDGNRAVLWTQEFPSLRESESDDLEQLVHLADLDGDDRNEVLFVLARSFGETDAVHCYGPSGALRWSYAADDWLNGSPALPGSYKVRPEVGIVSDGSRTFLLLHIHHNVEATARIVLLDPQNGRPVDEFWHPGRLYSQLILNLDDDPGDEIILAGYNNPRALGHPAVVVLDVPFDQPEANPAAKENYYGAWNAKERDYILFPRIPGLTVNRQKTAAEEVFFDSDTIAFVTGGELSGFGAYYYFDARLEKLLRYRPSDPMLAYHRTLYNNGVLPRDATEAEIIRWARCKRFPTTPDGDDPEIVGAIEESDETASWIHTGQTPPPPIANR